MINLIFTLDYEIHGNGDGDPKVLMVEPTFRLMNLLEKYGAKLTIMADVAEILCFRRYFEETGVDRFHVLEIEEQLRDAVRRGHDVQLHIHSSYFNAKYDGRRWDQCIEEYNMAALSFERIYEMVSSSVRYLENLLRSVNPDYRCIAFRAANWSMMPTKEIYRALVENGIRIDTSVYKGGRQGGNVCYDYCSAYSSSAPYPACPDDINRYSSDGLLIEFPIYTEMRHFWSFFSYIRFFRMIRARFHKHKHVDRDHCEKGHQIADNRHLRPGHLLDLYPRKFDFNQLTSFQMKRTLRNIVRGSKLGENQYIVMIGHSKSYISGNDISLNSFMSFAREDMSICFSDFHCMTFYD